MGVCAIMDRAARGGSGTTAWEWTLGLAEKADFLHGRRGAEPPLRCRAAGDLVEHMQRVPPPPPPHSHRVIRPLPAPAGAVKRFSAHAASTN